MQKIGEVKVMGERLDILVLDAPAYRSKVKIFLADSEGDEWASVTTNVPEADLEAGEFTVKTWSENEMLREPLLSSGLFIDTGKRCPTGFVAAEVWRLQA